ncbi:hypothetical protein KW447_19025 [Vibrio fluvialis]|nr:hypothetical protein [Vibrio fluvialis]
MKNITDEMHKHHTMFQGAGTHMPRLGTKKVQVQQDLEEYLSLKGKNAAYKEWLHKLNRNDKLPRGKFFKGKKAGKPIIIMDEFWQFCSTSKS